MTRLLLVDDDPRTRQGLRMLLELEAGMTVVGEAGDGREAIALASVLDPDIVVMDVEMPAMDGIAATRALRARARRVAVVVLSVHDDEESRERAIAAGAAAFVAKHEGPAALLAALSRGFPRRGPPIDGKDGGLISRADARLIGVEDRIVA